MADAEQSEIEQLAEAIGMVATGHRVAKNQTARNQLGAAMVRWANAWLDARTPQPAEVKGGITDDSLQVIRDWIAGEKTAMELFEKAGKEYPGCNGSNGVTFCDVLLNEVDRLRGRK